MKFRKSASENQSNRNLPSVLIQTLQSLEVESLILLPGEEVIFQSAGLSNFGLMKDERISSEELLALIRVVRRTKETHRGTIELARGPLGGGCGQGHADRRWQAGGAALAAGPLQPAGRCVGAGRRSVLGDADGGQ